MNSSIDTLTVGYLDRLSQMLAKENPSLARDNRAYMHYVLGEKETNPLFCKHCGSVKLSKEFRQGQLVRTCAECGWHSK